MLDFLRLCFIFYVLKSRPHSHGDKLKASQVNNQLRELVHIVSIPWSLALCAEDEENKKKIHIGIVSFFST